MKKLLLILLCFPDLLVSQDLPIIYASTSGEKYINREEELRKAEITLQQEIKDFTYKISQITEKQIQEEYKDDPEMENFYYFYKKHSYISRSDYLGRFDAWEGDYVPSGVYEPYASSTLIDKRGRYNYEINNIGDEDLLTTWVEGESDYGIGEYIEFKYFFWHGDGSIMIYNGFQKTIDLWKNNSRVKTFKVYLNNVPLCFLELEDKMAVQSFNPEVEKICDNHWENVIRLEIYEVYQGEKWKDVCISDILYIYAP